MQQKNCNIQQNFGEKEINSKIAILFFPLFLFKSKYQLTPTGIRKTSQSLNNLNKTWTVQGKSYLT